MDIKEQAIDAIYESGMNCEWVDDLLMHFIESAEFEGYLSENTFYFSSHLLQYYVKNQNGSLAFLAVSQRLSA